MYRFKKFIFYISISTLAIIFLFIVIGTQYESKINLKNLKTSIIQGFKSVRIKEEKYKLNYDGITFAINMPIVEYEDKNIERYINTYIRKNVNQFINLKKQERDISRNHDDVKVKINFHTAFEDKNLLNIIIYKDIYIKEKNYERIKDSYVFDLKTGQRVYIDNFLKNNEDYEYVLENYILSKIDKNKIDINKNKITINKYTNYYITDEGIGIYFNPYQISKRKEIYEFKVPSTVFIKKVKTLKTSPIVAQIDTQTITKNNDYINSIVNIPIVLTDNKAIEKNINDTIKKDIMKSYYSVEEDAKNYLSNTPKEYIQPYIYNVNFDVKKNSDNMLSILIKYYQFSGGAHGMDENKSYNIYMKDGKFLELKDFFKSNSDYKKVINNEIRNQIKNKKDQVYEFKSISDNQKFYIEDDNIVIYFDLYDIAPFAAGIPEFKININQISHILDEKYINIFK